MRSEAQKKADTKYKATKTTKLNIELNKTTDADIINKLEKVPNKTGYIKALIRNNIKKDPE